MELLPPFYIDNSTMMFIRVLEEREIRKGNGKLIQTVEFRSFVFWFSVT